VQHFLFAADLVSAIVSPCRLCAKAKLGPARGPAVFSASRSSSPDDPRLLSGLRGRGAWGVSVNPKPPRARSGEDSLLPDWQSHSIIGTGIFQARRRRRSDPLNTSERGMSAQLHSGTRQRRIMPPPHGLRATYGMHTESSYMRAVATEEIEQVRV
jgi:hypothetical protein